jgi:hypothetical protein
MTAPVQPEPEPTPKPVVSPPPEPEVVQAPPGPHSAPEPEAATAPVAQYAPTEPVAILAQPLAPPERETVFVPRSVTIGDGFKFGCGFFLALVLAMLIGFVLLAALFVLTSLFGLNLPITR